MRVSFFGKGGSGKTTVSSSFISYLLKKKENVLAIDADMNVHLAKVFDMPVNIISKENEEIVKFLEPNRNIPIIGTTPPIKDSKFIKVSKEDSFLKKYATFKDNLMLLTVGTYTLENVGSDCYHSKLNTLELIYHRLLDTNKDYVVTDSTAGIDSLGTSLFFVSDINVFIVEPTKKGISVYKDFNDIASKLGIKTYVIGNKVTDKEDEDFLIKEVGKENILGFIKSSKNLRKYEQGEKEYFDEFINENKDVYENLISVMKNTPRDWKKYYERLKKVYVAACLDWYSEYYKEDLTKYIDQDFSYEEVEV